LIRFLILGRFPVAVRRAVDHGVMARALEDGLFAIEAKPLNDWGLTKHAKIDDRPFGGGVGLVLRPDVVIPAIRWARTELPGAPVVMVTPQGEPATQTRVAELANAPGAIFLCGRYEGFDERIRAHVDREISLGDFVLSGGELAAACLIDAAARLIPGVLGKLESTADESHADGLLEHPHYTQPAVFEGEEVPEVLRGGHHARIAAWRHSQSVARTAERRPDLHSAWLARGDD
jgi:tRNA (guanine37-N1)-methyltransferase